MRMRWLLIALLGACSAPAPHDVRATPPPTAPQDAGAATTSGAPADAARPLDAPSAPQCPQKPRPAGCPATEPNVNHPCSPKGIECTYAPGCCPIVYVCDKTGHFEARFSRCE